MVPLHLRWLGVAERLISMRPTGAIRWSDAVQPYMLQRCCTCMVVDEGVSFMGCIEHGYRDFAAFLLGFPLAIRRFLLRIVVLLLLCHQPC